MNTDEASSAAATANNSSAIGATGGAVPVRPNARYFSDSKNKNSWVCGQLGVDNSHGCGTDNYNSRFLCRTCQRGKPGERAKRASLLEDSASDEARKMQR